MFSRVWSVPLKVGSLPWSAVRTTRSPGFSSAISSGRRRSNCFQAGGIAGDVAAVAVELVEVDEVGEDEVAVLGLAHRFQRGGELRLVVGRLQDLGDAAAGEDVGDLADAPDVALHLDARSSSVSPGGGTAKSLRLPVRLNSPARSPTKGRAMTRPIFSGSQSLRAIPQTS